MNDLAIPETTSIDSIRSRIFTIRGIQVMLDRDLAELYGVPTKRLNEQVRRNAERFPDDFMFHLSKSEMSELVANCDRFNKMKHSSFNAQHGNTLTVKESTVFHDRFLIIDKSILIHVGASLNFLGKRCFAFASLDKSNIPDILAKI